MASDTGTSRLGLYHDFDSMDFCKRKWYEMNETLNVKWPGFGCGSSQILVFFSPNHSLLLLVAECNPESRMCCVVSWFYKYLFICVRHSTSVWEHCHSHYYLSWSVCCKLGLWDRSLSWCNNCSISAPASCPRLTIL